MNARFDHLIIAAQNRLQGQHWIRAEHGLHLPDGGQHLPMGTHNAVAACGVPHYLEVIAIDPQGITPHRPRWFGLDTPAVQAWIHASPQVLTWALAVDDLDDALRRCPWPAGVATTMQRGSLSWRIAIPENGELWMGGAAPSLIEWPAGLGPGHPSEHMADCGARLESLVLTVPQADGLHDFLASAGCIGLQTAGDAPMPADMPPPAASPTPPTATPRIHVKPGLPGDRTAPLVATLRRLADGRTVTLAGGLHSG